MKKIYIELENLLRKHDQLLEMTHNLIYDNDLDVSNYDTMPIDGNRDFAKHKRDTYQQLLKFEEIAINEDKVSRLLQLREKVLANHIKKFSEDRVGTVLNILRELWNDILLDFKRNKIKGGHGTW